MMTTTSFVVNGVCLLALVAVVTARGWPTYKDACRGVKCEPGKVCFLKEVQCTKPPCYPQPQCVPDPCSLIDCAPGNACLLRPVQCFRAPCNPQPQCVPDPCLHTKCGRDTRCVLKEVKKIIPRDPVAVCVPKCPKPTGGICVELCTEHEDCGTSEACCSNGCGHVCVKY